MSRPAHGWLSGDDVRAILAGQPLPPRSRPTWADDFLRKRRGVDPWGARDGR